MKWVPDRTGRFPKRPHYTPDEFDKECEQLVATFLAGRHSKVEFPISTEDLTVLMESMVDDLDMYADLSGEPGEVEGVTEFRHGRKPITKIARELTNAEHLHNRLRTTLTHELGHVHFHGFLFEMQPSGKPLFEVSDSARVNKCKRESIVGARESDWMEWQAGYACGALLMPMTSLRRVVQDLAKELDWPGGQVGVASAEGGALIDKVAGTFQTSRDAARVRLLQRGFLAQASAGRGLF